MQVLNVHGAVACATIACVVWRSRVRGSGCARLLHVLNVHGPVACACHQNVSLTESIAQL